VIINEERVRGKIKYNYWRGNYIIISEEIGIF
jgi:hypothetical protein